MRTVNIAAAVTQDEEGWWIAEALGLREGYAAVDQGSTEAEALRNLATAVAGLLEADPNAIDPSTHVVTDVPVPA